MNGEQRTVTDLPGAVLFACTENALRSPMAESILKHFHGRQIYVDSVGVRAGEGLMDLPLKFWTRSVSISHGIVQKASTI